MYDTTNFDLQPLKDGAPPLVHPGCINVGDIVQALCHFVLHADCGGPPSYRLHLEQINILAVRKN